jgi:broad specificity phosphatase PhoE
MANYDDMYKFEPMSDGQRGLNEPTEVAFIYEDTDQKKVYKQVSDEMKKKIKAEAKKLAEANKLAKAEQKSGVKPPVKIKSAVTAPVIKPEPEKKPEPEVKAPEKKPEPGSKGPVKGPGPGPVKKEKDEEEPVKKEDEPINFYWVRHAESVANMYNNKPTDKYDEKVQDAFKNEIRTFLKQDYDNVQLMLGKEPSLSGGGANEPIIAGTYPLVTNVYKFINEKVEQAKKETDKYTPYEKECKSFADESDLQKRFPFEKDGKDANNYECIEKLNKNYKNKDKKVERGDDEASKFYALWLQNFIPSNFLFQPTLTQCGMVQARILGEQFLPSSGKLSAKQVQPDIVITSAAVRTMMTAYLTLLYAGDETITDQTIYVVPYLNEEENDAEYVFKNSPEKLLHDFCNYAIAQEKIRAVGEAITNWFNEPGRQIYDKDGTTLIDIKKNVNEKIKFNYDLYEKHTDEKYRKNNIRDFFAEIFDQEAALKDKKNVLAFCHGYVVNTIRDQLFNPKEQEQEKLNTTLKSLKTGGMNTSVFQNTYTPGGFANIKPIYGDAGPEDIAAINATENATKNPITDPLILAKFGLIYYPEGDNTIRSKAKEILQMDITVDEPAQAEERSGVEGQAQQMDPLISLRRGSLRGDIAWITHGGGGGVEKTLPKLSYPENANIFTVGTAIPDIEYNINPAPNDENTNYDFTSVPPLPAGLTLVNGIIAGTPTTVTEEKGYTITARSNEPNEPVLSVIFTCQVKEAEKESSPNPILAYNSSKIELIQGVSFPTLTLVTPGFTGFSSNPSLPTGFTLNTETGEITGMGTADTILPKTDYTIKAKYANAPLEQETTVSIQVDKKEISIKYGENNVIEAEVGVEIVSITPKTGALSAEEELTFEQPSDFPPGLKVDEKNGAISGKLTTQINTTKNPFNIKVKSNKFPENDYTVPITINTPVQMMAALRRAPPSTRPNAPASTLELGLPLSHVDGAALQQYLFTLYEEPTLQAVNANNFKKELKKLVEKRNKENKYVILTAAPKGKVDQLIINTNRTAFRYLKAPNYNDFYEEELERQIKVLIDGQRETFEDLWTEKKGGKKTKRIKKRKSKKNTKRIKRNRKGKGQTRKKSKKGKKTTFRKG